NAELIRRHIGRHASRVDPAIAEQVAASAEYMVRSAAGLPVDEASLGFVTGWADLPAATRRAGMVEVGNRARLSAGSIIDLLHVQGIDTNVAQRLQEIRERIGAPAKRPVKRPAEAATENHVGPAPATAGPERLPAEPMEESAFEPASVAKADSADPQVIAAVNADAWAYFRARAEADTVASEYLAGRSITAGGLLPVGYAPPDVRLGAHLRSLGHSDQVQIEAGLARPLAGGRVVDVFRDRVVAAFVDDRGQVAGFTARALGDKGPKYLNTKATALFDKSTLLYGLTPDARARLAAGATPVLVEGMMDVLAITQYAPELLVPIATCGTAFTKAHAADLFEAMPQARIIVAYDSDQAGIAAAVKAGRMLSEEGWQVRCPAPQNGLDPADVAAQRGAKVIDWASWDAARPAIYLAAEHQLAAIGRADGADDRRTAGAKVIDYLQREWGTDNELKNAVDYVGMNAGLYRPAAADVAHPAAARQPAAESAPARWHEAVSYSQRRLRETEASGRAGGLAR
ncbi:MAG: toprim domain-containing protein, partial [Nakamurella sp.]